MTASAGDICPAVSGKASPTHPGAFSKMPRMPKTSPETVQCIYIGREGIMQRFRGKFCNKIERQIWVTVFLPLTCRQISCGGCLAVVARLIAWGFTYLCCVRRRVCVNHLRAAVYMQLVQVCTSAVVVGGLGVVAVRRSTCPNRALKGMHQPESTGTSSHVTTAGSMYVTVPPVAWPSAVSCSLKPLRRLALDVPCDAQKNAFGPRPSYTKPSTRKVQSLTTVTVPIHLCWSELNLATRPTKECVFPQFVCDGDVRGRNEKVMATENCE